MLTTSKRGTTKVKQHQAVCELIDRTDGERNPLRLCFLLTVKERLERQIRIEDDLMLARSFMRNARVLTTSLN